MPHSAMCPCSLSCDSESSPEQEEVSQESTLLDWEDWMRMAFASSPKTSRIMIGDLFALGRKNGGWAGRRTT